MIAVKGLSGYLTKKNSVSWLKKNAPVMLVMHVLLKRNGGIEAPGGLISVQIGGLGSLHG